MDISLREQGVYLFGPFRLDPARRALLCHGERVKLPERLFDTLLYLVVNQGRLVQRDELLQAVWGGRIVEENNLAQAIFGLRKVLTTPDTDEKFIVTTPGRGYRFAAPVVFEAETAAPYSPVDAPPEAPPSRSPLMARAAFAMAGLALMLAALSLAHRAWIAPRKAAAFAPPAHSVAVLAFDNLTGDPAERYVSDGLSEQLIDSLTGIAGLQVAARSSAFAFRDQHAGLADMARRLNVATVLEGSVRRQGTALRITAQLVNTRTGFTLWSKTYDRPQGDILALEGDIAQAVTQSLQGTLLGGNVTKLALGGTANPAAFDAYLRAVRLQRVADTPSAYRAALAGFDAALALDPSYARVHAARAFLLARLGELGDATDQAALRRMFADARAAADRAVALAPDLGAAHSVRGLVLGWGFLDLAGNVAEQTRALALTPGSASIERNYANAAMALGHVPDALAALQRATALDPVSPESWGGLARALYFARRIDAAQDALRHAMSLADRPSMSLTYLAGQLALMRHDPEAARQACAAAASWQQNEVLAIAYHSLGRPAEAAAQLATLHARLGDRGAYNYAVVAAQWGRTDEALLWLDHAVTARDPGLTFMQLDPMLDPLRGAPQFQQAAQHLASGP